MNPNNLFVLGPKTVQIAPSDGYNISPFEALKIIFGSGATQEEFTHAFEITEKCRLRPTDEVFTIAKQLIAGDDTNIVHFGWKLLVEIADRWIGLDESTKRVYLEYIMDVTTKKDYTSNAIREAQLQCISTVYMHGFPSDIPGMEHWIDQSLRCKYPLYCAVWRRLTEDVYRFGLVKTKRQEVKIRERVSGKMSTIICDMLQVYAELDDRGRSELLKPLTLMITEMVPNIPPGAEVTVFENIGLHGLSLFRDEEMFQLGVELLYEITSRRYPSDNAASGIVGPVYITEYNGLALQFLEADWKVESNYKVVKAISRHGKHIAFFMGPRGIFRLDVAETNQFIRVLANFAVSDTLATRSNGVAALAHLWGFKNLREECANFRVAIQTVIGFLSQGLEPLGRPGDESLAGICSMFDMDDDEVWRSNVIAFRSLALNFVRKVLTEADGQLLEEILRLVHRAIYVRVHESPERIHSDIWASIEKFAKSLSALTKNPEAKNLSNKNISLILQSSYKCALDVIKRMADNGQWILVGKILALLSPLICILCPVYPNCLEDSFKTLCIILSACNERSVTFHVTAHMVGLVSKHVNSEHEFNLPLMASGLIPAWEKLTLMQRVHLREIFSMICGYATIENRTQLLSISFSDLTQYIASFDPRAFTDQDYFLKKVLAFERHQDDPVGIEMRSTFRAVFISVSGILKRLKSVDLNELRFYLDPLVNVYYSTLAIVNGVLAGTCQRVFHESYPLPVGMSKAERDGVLSIVVGNGEVNNCQDNIEEDFEDFDTCAYFYTLNEAMMNVMEPLVTKYPCYMYSYGDPQQNISNLCCVPLTGEVDHRLKRWLKTGWKTVLVNCSPLFDKGAMNQLVNYVFVDVFARIRDRWAIYEKEEGCRTLQDMVERDHLTVALSREFVTFLRYSLIRGSGEDGDDNKSGGGSLTAFGIHVNSNPEWFRIVAEACMGALFWPDTKTINLNLQAVRHFVSEIREKGLTEYWEPFLTSIIQCTADNNSDIDFYNSRMNPLMMFAADQLGSKDLLNNLLQRVPSERLTTFFQGVREKMDAKEEIDVPVRRDAVRLIYNSMAERPKISY